MHFYKIFSYRNENRHSTSFTKYKDNIFTKIIHEETWPLHYWPLFLVSSSFTLIGSGSGSLDGIPGSLDGLHKTSWNSHMKDLIVDDDVSALCSTVSDLELTFCSKQPALPDNQCDDPALWWCAAALVSLPRILQWLSLFCPALFATEWPGLPESVLLVPDLVEMTKVQLLSCFHCGGLFWIFLWNPSVVAQVSSFHREDICMKFWACRLLVLSPCVSEYKILLLNWWLVNTWL